MRVVLLNEQQFDSYSKNHPLNSYYQTTSYGNLMKTCGYSVAYYGFVENNIIVAASLILFQKLYGSFKYAYAPRGLLIDYNNKDLLNKVTNALKSILQKQNVVFLKIDPLAINNIRDRKGNILPFETNKNIVSDLEALGYKHFGFNNYFETLKPRLNAYVKLDISSLNIFNSLRKNARNKIRKAISRGVEIYEGSETDLEIFYSFVHKKHHRNLNYYKNFQNYFKENFEIYIAKLNSNSYLKSIQAIYEQETTKNDKLNNDFLKEMDPKKKKKIIAKKMNSDKVLSVYKRELNFATSLASKKPNGVIIGSCAIVKDNGNLHLLIEGYDSNYKPFYPTFLLKWFIIEKYHDHGYNFFDLNGVSGDFSKENKYYGLNEMKTSFNANIYEFIGEFDLIIMPTIYNFYSKSKLGQKILKKNAK